ncbi:uncharacterized protein BDV17DRAFT_274222 [Aspergillus undulatus]|uniref:uncharacterized protein n=1 Tax=Aspergillus undulatus TaxID=1810928 RepID=UPI003CCC9207
MSIEAITAIAADYMTILSMSEVFTPPSACATSWTYEPEQANDVTGGLIIQNAATLEPTCFPSSFSQVGRIPVSQIYSPGYCPVGYTSADVAVDGPTTTAVCCLSDFDYFTSIKSYGDSNEDLFAGCISIYPSTTSTIIPVRQETTKTQVIGPVTMWAQPITIALEADDSSLFVSPTTSSTASVASRTPATTTTTEPEETVSVNQTDVPTAEEDSSSGGLSTPAAIGLGVGVGIGGLAAFAAVGLWLWRSRRAKKQIALVETTTAGANNSPEGPYHQQVPPGPWTATTSEIDGTAAPKTQHRDMRHELYG